MSFGKVADYLFIIFIAVANGMPQNKDTVAQGTSESLPFLQFTNGGIRLNFAGYHAQAGLGGILRDGRTGGGLHVSAGTPWGAQAGAGLGGRLNGQDGSTGGGLYAHARASHGGPEAAAGLGGKLDGSGRSLSPVSGGLYAGATPGGGPGPGVYFGNMGREIIDTMAGPFPPVVDEFDAAPRASGGEEITTNVNANAGETKPTKGHTNIQIIRSKPKNEQKEKEVAVEVAALPADAPASGKTESQVNEVRRAVQYVAVPATKVGVLGTFSAGTAPVVKSIEKTIVAAPAPAVAVPVPVPVPAQSAAQTNTTVITAVDKNPSAVVVSKSVHPRWYFRKRFRTVPRKVVYVSSTATDSQSAPSDVAIDGHYTNVVGDGGAVIVGKTYTSGSLFNDIFNIPISTLSAVNQLLNNIG